MFIISQGISVRQCGNVLKCTQICVLFTCSSCLSVCDAKLHKLNQLKDQTRLNVNIFTTGIITYCCCAKMITYRDTFRVSAPWMEMLLQLIPQGKAHAVMG